MLFKISSEPIEKQGLSESEIDSEHIFLNEMIEKDISIAIGQLRDKACYHYVSDNTWSLHELMIYCIKQIGPCELWFSAYSIKEQPARAISTLYHNGLIKSIHCILDTSIDKTCEHAVQIIKPIAADLKYTDIHAKCVVLLGEKLQVSIVGSQNFTRNKRVEMGVVTVSQKVAEFRQLTIKNLISNGNN